MVGRLLCQLRLACETAFLRVNAAGRKAAHGRRLNGRGDLPLEQNALLLFLQLWTGNRRQQCLGVGVVLMAEQLPGLRLFHHGAQIHD